jgi:hypothetical protein
MIKIVFVFLLLASTAFATYYPPAGGSETYLGDVVGPSSSTDNAICRMDGTTGKLIQNTSNSTVTDAGAINIPLGSAALPAYSFATATGMGWYGADTQTMVWACAGARKFSFSCTDDSWYFENSFKLNFGNGGTNTYLQAPASGGGYGIRLPIANAGANGEVLKGTTADPSILSFSTGFTISPTGSASVVGVAADPCGNTTNYPHGSLWFNSTAKEHCTCIDGVDVRIKDYSTACF